jgi:hypothetical protein
MKYLCLLFRSIVSRRILHAVAATIALTLIAAAPASALSLKGKVVDFDDKGLSNYTVSLYGGFFVAGRTQWRRLGVAESTGAGRFRIAYALPTGENPLLFVQASRGKVMLASALGRASRAPTQVVVNPRTTVATGTAYAQFVNGRKIVGNTYGMINAARMAANLANPVTGAVGKVLARTPNGRRTTTLATFNSLTNIVASCIATASNCTRLFNATTPTGGAAPTNVLQAIANIAKYPSYPGYPDNADDPLFRLSKVTPVYTPALAARPTSWLLFLKFTGGFYSEQAATNLMNGPGNIAIDEKGYAWVDANYTPRKEGHFACAGRRLMKFYPWGANFPGSPYKGGGLNGAGYGIVLDLDNNVWVGNFGFEDPPCQFIPELAATKNSVSVFGPDGAPLSPSTTGYTAGRLNWPQGMAADRRGRIWVANCGSDSVTRIVSRSPFRARNIPLGPASSRPKIKPFGVSVDLEGNVWVNGNISDKVYVLSPDGSLIKTWPAKYKGKTILSHPVGNAADSRGNIWVANSDWLSNPCPARKRELGTAENPSVTMFQAKNHKPHPGSPFTGGGITLPWGITTDGNDTVWVFNFGVIPPPGNEPGLPPNGISRFCGVSTEKCPSGLKVGDPISPSTGYRSNALTRLTGGQVDPSGNLWLMNNWKLAADPFVNPGGNSIVIVVGAAGPLKTPTIGPPVSFANGTAP